MAEFQNLPPLTGFNAPFRAEADRQLICVSMLPSPNFASTYYRLQPDPQFLPRPNDDSSFAARSKIPQPCPAATGDQ